MPGKGKPMYGKTVNVSREIEAKIKRKALYWTAGFVGGVVLFFVSFYLFPLEMLGFIALVLFSGIFAGVIYGLYLSFYNKFSNDLRG